jgi:hypothetical protein
MSSTGTPRPPASAGVAGKRLWRAVLGEYELSGGDLELLRHAVLVADELQQLEELVRASGPLIKDRDGNPCPNPASQQHRLLALTLGRLLAGIQVVGDVADVHDPARPQKRSGFRGAYKLRAVELCGRRDLTSRSPRRSTASMYPGTGRVAGGNGYLNASNGTTPRTRWFMRAQVPTALAGRLRRDRWATLPTCSGPGGKRV